MFEIDILRDQSHDMMADDGIFSTLLKMAMDGMIDGIIGGPNCRTRSALRHQPHETMPGPSRTVAHPWGLPENSDVERARCYIDDVLLYRMILLQVVARAEPQGHSRSEGEVPVGADSRTGQ